MTKHETIHMSRATQKFLGDYFYHLGMEFLLRHPGPLYEQPPRVLAYRGVAIAIDDSLPFGNFYRERVA